MKSDMKTIPTEKSFLEGVHYEKKIAALNQNIVKLNEIIESNIRKSIATEKETKFLTKKVRETEHLNMKLMNELSTKNQIIEDLMKKNAELLEKSYSNNNTKAKGLTDDDYLIKLISDKLASDLRKVSVHDRLNNNIDSFLQNTEIKILVSNRTSKVQNIATRQSFSFKRGVSPSRSNESEEINLTQDTAFKALLKTRLVDEGKQQKRGKFKTDKGYSYANNKIGLISDIKQVDESKFLTNTTSPNIDSTNK